MDIEVPMGELAVTEEEDNLTSQAVGSCLAVALYDPRLKIAGLLHAMLPHARGSEACPAGRSLPKGDAQQAAKYVDAAIDLALEKMRALGADKKNIEAKLVGGANMFSAFKSDIGEANISAAREKLKKAGVAIVGECVGGSQGRSVEFSAASGIVTVKIRF